MHALNNKFEDNVITVEDIRQAIYIVEYFSFHYERFLTGGGADDIDIILSIFKENKNKWLQMKDLTRHHDFKKLAFKGRTARQIMGIYENELTRRAEENGDVLKVESVGKSGTQYKLINKYIESPAEL